MFFFFLIIKNPVQFSKSGKHQHGCLRIFNGNFLTVIFKTTFSSFLRFNRGERKPVESGVYLLVHAESGESVSDR